VITLVTSNSYPYPYLNPLGRRSSALGTMSVSEAYIAFSVEVVVAGKASPTNDQIMKDLEQHSRFLDMLKPDLQKDL
jgi:hypothetical protein